MNNSSRINHKTVIDAHRDAIIEWYSLGASNVEVANRLNISIAALHRHTMHWEIKKIRKHRRHKATQESKPLSNTIKHLATRAKWKKPT